MKKDKKKLTRHVLAWVLSLALVVSFIPFTTFANEGTDNSKEVEYTAMSLSSSVVGAAAGIAAFTVMHKAYNNWMELSNYDNKYMVQPRFTLPQLQMLMSYYPKANWDRAFKTAGFIASKYAYDKAAQEWKEIPFKVAAAIFAAAAAQGIVINLSKVFKYQGWQNVYWPGIKWAVLAKGVHDWAELLSTAAKVKKGAKLATAAVAALTLLTPKVQPEIYSISIEPVKKSEKERVNKYLDKIGYDLTDEDYVVEYDDNGKIKILYKVEVTGTAGATFLIDDQDSRLLTPAINLIQNKDTIKGYIPYRFAKDGKVTETFYVTKTFDEADAITSTPPAHHDLTFEVKSNTAKVAEGCIDTATVYTDKMAQLKYVVDGEVVKTEDVAAGTAVDVTKFVPTKESNTFEGWFDNEGLTGEPLTDVKVLKTVTVYGKFVATPVPEALNADDHFAYLIGYPDGTIIPGKTITRAEAATIFFRLLKDQVRSANLVKTNEFSDVNKGDWFNTAISTLAAMDVATGYEDGTYRPNAPITRAEFISMCVRFNDTGFSAESAFSDTAGSWAKENIDKAFALGWANGYSGSDFEPDQLITRAEVATIVNRVLHRIPADENALLPNMRKWSDNKAGEWYYLAIQEATNSHYAKVDEAAGTEAWTDLMKDRDWTAYEE